jgi:serine O-acetyltransferase
MLIIRVMYNAYIHYRAEIGPGVSFEHKMGILIGYGAKIGARVKIQHLAHISKRAVIEDDVLIGTGAKVLGEVHIGRGAKIGANAVVVNDVPAYTLVVGIPAKPKKFYFAEGRTKSDKT